MITYTEELKDQARVLQRDLKALKEIQHPLYDYELHRAAKWLREEAGWLIVIDRIANSPDLWARCFEREWYKQELIIWDESGNLKHFPTYEQALESAVEMTLTHIINNNQTEQQ